MRLALLPAINPLFKAFLVTRGVRNVQYLNHLHRIFIHVPKIL